MEAKSFYAHFLYLFVSLFIISANAYQQSCPLKSKPLTYELHGTKTIYEDALKALDSKKELKGSFDEDTLEDEHHELTDDGCEPVVFYFVGRHSARFPDREDIIEQNNLLKDIQAKLSFVNKNAACPTAYTPFLEWKTQMLPDQDNLITELGANEEESIGRRFKKLYPKFFDANTADITVGVTKKIRTAQTAAEFMRVVDGWKLSYVCKNIPTNNATESGYNLNEILRNQCYETLMRDNALPMLWFHDQCEVISGKVPKNPLSSAIKKPEVLRPIVNKVESKLQLPRGSLADKAMDAIYNTCKFENAISNYSIWCDLLDKEDVEAYEYTEDVKSYLNDAYGENANTKQACPIISDLISKFKDGSTMSGINGEKKKSYFHFSHAGAMKKFIAAFGVFEDKKSYSEDQITEFMRTLKAPSNRRYRSSLLVPFSANMAFILYRCNKPKKNEIKYKMLTVVTEHPVKLKGCGSTDCNFDKFMKEFSFMEKCDLKEICRPKNASITK